MDSNNLSRTIFDRQIDFDIEKFLTNVTLEISVWNGHYKCTKLIVSIIS